jgi:hypothetical protein
VAVDASGLELQQYLFDLHGYLVIHNVLKPAEVAELNGLIVPAGSAVLFTEAVMHGTAPSRADHERRTLLYKYCVSQMAWSRARVLPPPGVPLTPRQQALLTEPADPHTFVPSLFSDGPGVER